MKNIKFSVWITYDPQQNGIPFGKFNFSPINSEII